MMLSQVQLKLPRKMTFTQPATPQVAPQQALAQLGYRWWLAIVLLDQLTKYLILQHVMVPTVAPLGTLAVTDFFNLVLVWNRGTSFSLIYHEADFMPYVLAMVALGICLWLHRWLCRAEDRLHAVALGLVLGGAIGNVFDRLLHGAVVDFLDFHYAGWHWPAFNVADSAIVIGVCMLLLGGFRKKT